MIEIIRIEPCSRTPAPSKVTDSIAAAADERPRTLISEASERTSVARVIKSCEAARDARGPKASTKTPSSAPPSTIKIGARSA